MPIAFLVRRDVRFGDDFPRLLAAARLGAEWAWGRLYRELAPSVLGYLRAGGAVEPEDVLGEVFLQVVRDLARFQGGEPEFRRWLFTIAHHRMLDARRRERRRPVEAAPDEVLERRGALGDAEDEAMAALGAERVRMLVRTLTTDQQDVLFLRLFGDLAVDDVAAILGKRPGAVKALQRRGLAALRGEISREGVPL
jgi:RNA polymerase sigma-70 factor (ECF subfamily)